MQCPFIAFLIDTRTVTRWEWGILSHRHTIQNWDGTELFNYYPPASQSQRQPGRSTQGFFFKPWKSEEMGWRQLSWALRKDKEKWGARRRDLTVMDANRRSKTHRAQFPIYAHPWLVRWRGSTMRLIHRWRLPYLLPSGADSLHCSASLSSNPSRPPFFFSITEHFWVSLTLWTYFSVSSI